VDMRLEVVVPPVSDVDRTRDFRQALGWRLGAGFPADEGFRVVPMTPRLPGEGRALGLWRAQDTTEMQAILKSLPLDAWMTVETRALTQHPSDPGLAVS
jgi:muconolactone delta-isomerase